MAIFLVGIEGHDYAGKSTLLEKVEQSLCRGLDSLPNQHFRPRVVKAKAPLYSSKTGKLLKEYLNGELELQPLEAVSLYSRNRHDIYEGIRDMHHKMNEHRDYERDVIVLMDRTRYSSLTTPIPGKTTAEHIDICEYYENLVENNIKNSLTYVVTLDDDTELKRRMDSRCGSESVANDGGQDIYENFDAVSAARLRYSQLPEHIDNCYLVDGSRVDQGRVFHRLAAEILDAWKSGKGHLPLSIIASNKGPKDNVNTHCKD